MYFSIPITIGAGQNQKKYRLCFSIVKDILNEKIKVANQKY